MRHKIRFAVLLLMASCAFAADQGGCPADKAGMAGNTAISGFHTVVAPCWHKAYPDKDYDALIKAGPEFEKAFTAIRNAEVKMKNKTRMAAYLENREKLAGYVASYAKAAREAAKEDVYKILPDLHNAFENCAVALLPTPYPELEAVKVTAKLILDKHLPANNTDGITGSTETLVMKLGVLKSSKRPEGIQGAKDKISQDIDTFASLGQQLKQSCADKNMGKYKSLITELNQRLGAFTEDYL